MTDEPEILPILSDAQQLNSLEIDEFDKENDVTASTDEGKGASPSFKNEVSSVSDPLMKHSGVDEASVDTLNVTSTQNSFEESSLTQLSDIPQNGSGGEITDELNSSAIGPDANPISSSDRSSPPPALADLVKDAGEDDLPKSDLVKNADENDFSKADADENADQDDFSKSIVAKNEDEDDFSKPDPVKDANEGDFSKENLEKIAGEGDSLDQSLPVISGRQSLASLPREAAEVEEEDYEDEEIVDSLRKPASSLSPDTKCEITDLPNSQQSPQKSVNTSKSNESTTKVIEKRHERAKQGPKETRGVGYMVEGPERVDAFIESRYPPSDLVYIRCLVRPFTVGQLTHMIESHFGKPVDLWLDKIKSSAVVRMENLDLAKRCREGLDGCRWPSINPRVLRCDFSNEELFSWLKLHGDSGERPPPRNLIGGLPDGRNDRTSPDPSPNKMKRLPSKSDVHTLADSHSEKRRKSANLSNPAVEKLQPESAKASTKVEEPAKALDDLFRKTTASPSIYWLPLTREEADSQGKLRMERFSAESARRNAASRRNQGAMRETRSPFTGPVVKESNAVNETLNRKPLGSNMATTREGRPVLQTDVSGRKSSPVKAHRKERSPFTAKRRASPPTAKQGGEVVTQKSRSPAGKSRLSSKRRRNSSPSPSAARAETRHRRSPPRISPTRRDGRR